ncbi:MAG: RHS repeat domain-containing protein, partial [Bacteroidales bacterium]
YGNGKEQHRRADKAGSIFGEDAAFCELGNGEQLMSKGDWHYRYNNEGFLVEKFYRKGGWLSTKLKKSRYYWNTEGMLEKVVTPEKHKVFFTYDALGRRLSKKTEYFSTEVEITVKRNYLWDGNVLLHEWSSGREKHAVTWVYDEESFTPTAKLQDGEYYSIESDHLGTPTHMYDSGGKQVWSCQLDINGKVLEMDGKAEALPHRYQGQYHDVETGLYYNRFRYYNPEDGVYISVDPLGLAGGINLYGYVRDSNSWIDPFGLARKPKNRLPEGKDNDLGPENGFLEKRNPDTDELMQRRYYDSEGKPDLDVDYGHDHGAGMPHAHDWDYEGQSPNKKKSEGRPLTEDEAEREKKKNTSYGK